MLSLMKEVRVATPKAKKEIDKLVEEGKVEIIGEVQLKTEPGELEKNHLPNSFRCVIRFNRGCNHNWWI